MWGVRRATAAELPTRLGATGVHKMELSEGNGNGMFRGIDSAPAVQEMKLRDEQVCLLIPLPHVRAPDARGVLAERRGVVLHVVAI